MYALCLLVHRRVVETVEWVSSAAWVCSAWRVSCVVGGAWQAWQVWVVVYAEGCGVNSAECPC